MRLLLPLLFLLAACAPVSDPYAYSLPTPASLGVANFDAQSTLAAAQAQQVAIQRQIIAVTESARATENAYTFQRQQTADAQAAAEAARALAVTQTADAIYLSMTENAITATVSAQGTAQSVTATAVSHEQTATQVANALTGTPLAQAIIGTGTAIARESERDAARQNSSLAWVAFRPFALLILFGALAFGLFLLLKEAGLMFREKRVRLVAYRDVSVLVLPGPDGPVFKMISAPPVGGPPEEWEYVNEPEPERMVPVHYAGGTRYMSLSQPAALSRDERHSVIRLLAVAMEAGHGGEIVIPSHTVLGMGGAAWQKAKNILESLDLVKAEPGHGTFIQPGERGERVLSDLYFEITHGIVPELSPPLPHSRRS